jgi:oxaloacetate decarboxylase gamma subunit
MSDALWTQAIDLMLFGMGSVFIFLGLLVVVTVIISKTISRLFPEQSVSPVPKSALSPTLPQATHQNVEPEIMSAIKAAIDKHRAQRL